jgi:hypothetical protein
MISLAGNGTAQRRPVRPFTKAVHLPGDWPGTVTEDRRGRLRIYLGRSREPREGWRRVTIRQGRRGRRRAVDAWVHPAATSGGWAWLPRYIVWRETQQQLRGDEHVHHECAHAGALRCTNPAHFRVVLAEYHGALHGAATLLWRQRDAGGRFIPQPPTFPIPRFGAILGRAAAALLREEGW